MHNEFPRSAWPRAHCRGCSATEQPAASRPRGSSWRAPPSSSRAGIIMFRQHLSSDRQRMDPGLEPCKHCAVYLRHGRSVAPMRCATAGSPLRPLRTVRWHCLWLWTQHYLPPSVAHSTTKGFKSFFVFTDTTKKERAPTAAPLAGAPSERRPFTRPPGSAGARCRWSA